MPKRQQCCPDDQLCPQCQEDELYYQTHDSSGRTYPGGGTYQEWKIRTDPAYAAIFGADPV